mgnify:CR=1 FL=1
MNEKSQGYARFLHEQLNQWAAENLDLPIIPEAILNDVVEFNPQLADGKNFLVEGFVDSIRRANSLDRNAGATKANGGLTMEEVAQMERIKIRIEFLEAQIAGNAGSATVSGTTGYVGTVTFEHSEAEKEAMKKELELLRAQLAAASKP